MTIDDEPYNKKRVRKGLLLLFLWPIVASWVVVKFLFVRMPVYIWSLREDDDGKIHYNTVEGKPIYYVRCNSADL